MIYTDRPSLTARGNLMIRELSLLFILASSTVCSVSFQRPWENRSWVAENPNIWSYGGEFWWNIPELGRTLSSFDSASLSRLGINGSTKTYLEKYESSVRKADSDRIGCFLDILGGIGVFPVDASFVFIKAFGSSSHCASYEDDWKSAVDSSLDAAESSVSEGDHSLELAKDAFERLSFLGLCQEHYSGPGSRECPELESAFASIDHDVAEGDFGKYPRIRALSSSLDYKLSEQIPDISASSDIIGLTWGKDGLLDSLSV